MALLLAATAALAAPARVAPAASPTPAAALHVATLAERVLKLQAQVGQGVLAARSRRALAEAVRGLEPAARALVAPGNGAEAREQVALLVLVTQQYAAWASRPATRDNARKLAERAEEVAWQATKVARLLAAPASASQAAALRAEEAALLAQRLGRLHLWRRWGLASESTATQVDEARARLRADLAALSVAAARLPALAPELQVAENQAVFLLDAVAREDGGAQAAEHAAKASDHLEEAMARVVAVCEERSP